MNYKTLSLFCFLLFLDQLATAQQTERRYLSGTGHDKTVSWQFYCTAGQNSGKWTTIPVPSNWELQGFGKYNYGFAKDSSRGKEQGLYKHEFQVPVAWKGKRIHLVFEGAMTDTEVKINGKSAGQHTGGRITLSGTAYRICSTTALGIYWRLRYRNTRRIAP